MDVTKTTIRGITTEENYEEGTTYTLVNLRPKDGALQPIAPRKIMNELSQKYEIVFLHQNNDYKNWLGVTYNGKYSSIYSDILSEKPVGIKTYLRDKIISIQQIGNTISLITSDRIMYLMYKNDQYIYLGELPQIPALSILTTAKANECEYYFVNEYDAGTVKADNFISCTKALVNKAIHALINGFTDKNGIFHEGSGLQLFDAHFIRYAFRLYDGTLTKHSPPLLVMPNKDITAMKTIDYIFANNALTGSSKVTVSGYHMGLYYNLSHLGEDSADMWKDIIKSVDIFISPPLGLSNIEKIRNDMPTTNIFIPGSDHLLHFNLIKEITPEGLKKVSTEANFYFIKSIPLGEEVSLSDPALLPSKDSELKTMDNLIYQEKMSDDNFSNHKYGAEVGYVYNNRLHLGDIKTTFFDGFSLKYFQLQVDYNGHTKPEDSKRCVFATEVEIQAGTSVQKVYSYYSADYSAFALDDMFAIPFLSYPDTRARKMNIYQIINGVWTLIFSKSLKAHDFLNLAYYMNEALKPIIAESKIEIVNPDTKKKVVLREPNKIKVSELNNPVNFPNANTYQVGNGSILAMASNAIRISEGQFGQYPLYVFTTQGIYSLNVGQGEVVYSNQSAPTSYEVPTTPIVASTPFGVVFTTARGICIIRGQEVQLLTAPLKDAPKALNIEFLDPMVDVIHKFEVRPFADYLRDLDNIVYNPHENELIIIDKETPYNYVLNLDSHAFYQSTEKIDLVVGNTFPELYIIGDKKLRDYKQDNFNQDGTAERAKVSFILRPLKYGTPYIKWLEKMQLFCTLYDANPLVYISCSSMDGVNFKAMSGMNLTQRGNYVKLETQRIARNKFSEFLFCFGSTISPLQSKINYIESWVHKEYDNNLMK